LQPISYFRHSGVIRYFDELNKHESVIDGQERRKYLDRDDGK
jgi:hypothetical protein